MKNTLHQKYFTPLFLQLVTELHNNHYQVHQKHSFVTTWPVITVGGWVIWPSYTRQISTSALQTSLVPINSTITPHTTFSSCENFAISLYIHMEPDVTLNGLKCRKCVEPSEYTTPTDSTENHASHKYLTTMTSTVLGNNKDTWVSFCLLCIRFYPFLFFL
jgi:hypothetical protein